MVESARDDGWREAYSDLPLWQVVAQTLRGGIAAGVHPVGALLPTEIELAAQFGVSRQTMRQAIAELRREGLLDARKGVGTRVLASAPARGYVHTLADLTELSQYARDLGLLVREQRLEPLRGRRAQEFGVRPGTPWLHIRGVRAMAEGETPFGLVEVWVDGRYAEAAAAAPARRQPIFAAIESAFGVRIEEVQQEVVGEVLDAAAAQALGAAPGSAALRVVRRYLASGGRLIEVAETLHPAARFRYAMTLRREGVVPA
jgi:DNA-binding GntR family transcriptional regulator